MLQLNLKVKVSKNLKLVLQVMQTIIKTLINKKLYTYTYDTLSTSYCMKFISDLNDFI